MSEALTTPPNTPTPGEAVGAQDPAATPVAKTAEFSPVSSGGTDAHVDPADVATTPTMIAGAEPITAVRSLNRRQRFAELTGDIYAKRAQWRIERAERKWITVEPETSTPLENQAVSGGDAKTPSAPQRVPILDKIGALRDRIVTPESKAHQTASVVRRVAGLAIAGATGVATAFMTRVNSYSSQKPGTQGMFDLDALPPADMPEPQKTITPAPDAPVPGKDLVALEAPANINPQTLRDRYGKAVDRAAMMMTAASFKTQKESRKFKAWWNDPEHPNRKKVVAVGIAAVVIAFAAKGIESMDNNVQGVPDVMDPLGPDVTAPEPEASTPPNDEPGTPLDLVDPPAPAPEAPADAVAQLPESVFGVLPGEGLTHTLENMTEQQGLSVSKLQLYEVYKILAAEGYMTSGDIAGTYVMPNGDYGYDSTGNHDWSPAVTARALELLEQQNAANQ